MKEKRNWKILENKNWLVFILSQGQDGWKRVKNLHIIFVTYNQEIGLVKKIPRIKFDNVDFICKQSDILKTIKRYFENLYRNVNNSREEYDLHEDLNYQNIKKLSFEE